MKVCSEIKRRIDIADNVEAFDIDVERHTAGCGDCRRFAEERAALRSLIASTARVTAPVNFDAQLRVRLAEAKARNGMRWLNPAFYLRYGAAAAALAAAVFVAQSTGLLTSRDRFPGAAGPVAGPIATAEQAAPTSGPAHSAATAPGPAVTSNPVTPAAAASGLVAVTGNPRVANVLRSTTGRSSRVPVRVVLPDVESAMDNGALLIRSRSGESEYTMPAVSIGAQPLVYVGSNRQTQSPRVLSASF